MNRSLGRLKEKERNNPNAKKIRAPGRADLSLSAWK
jgi:hypothetical protein